MKWKKAVDDVESFKDGKPLPTILIENKADLLPENERNNIENLKSFAKSNNFTAGFRTSAKTGLNITESMDFLIKNIISRLKKIHIDFPDNNSISIDPDKYLIKESCRGRPIIGCC